MKVLYGQWNNVILHINRQRDGDYVIILIDTHKVVDKIQLLNITSNTCYKLGVKGKFLILIKIIYEIFTMTLILSGERIHYKIGNKRSFQSYTGLSVIK